MARKKMSFQKGSVELKNGQWTLRYRDKNGKIKRVVLGIFRDKTAAQNAALLIMVRVNAENNSDVPPVVAQVEMSSVVAHSEMTFREFVEKDWKSYLQKRKRATKDCWGSLIKTHLLPYFGDRNLSEITPTEMQRFMDGLRGLSANSLHGVYNLVKLLFEIASQLDLIGKSPVRPLMHRPASVETTVEKPTLSFDDIKDILKALPRC
jgi:Phage integrase, N-terminal SAM-like domain